MIRKILVAGTAYTQALELYRNKIIRKDVPVRLVKEISNKFDPNAISIWIEDVRIGFVPKSQNLLLKEEGGLNYHWKILSCQKRRKLGKTVVIYIYCPEKYSANYIPSVPKAPPIGRPEFVQPNKKHVVYRAYCDGRVVYVGSTTRPLSERVKEHLRDLRRGQHVNQRLQDSYDNFGEEAIRFSVYEKIYGRSHLRRVELAVNDRIFRPRKGPSWGRPRKGTR